MTCTAPTPSTVLPLYRAVDHLPIGRDRAKRLLRERGVVRDLDGREVVVWGDVLDALAAGALAGDAVAKRRKQGSRARVSLR